MKYMQIGELSISLDIAHNVLLNAKYFFEKENNIHALTGRLSQVMTAIATFYELLFKYKMMLEDKKSIWVNKDKFDIEKHNVADFKSIQATDVLKYAWQQNWVNETEKNIIDATFKLRNKLLHFSICQQDESDEAYQLILEADFFDKHKALMIKQLVSAKEIFEKNYMFRDLQQKYFNTSE